MVKSVFLYEGEFWPTNTAILRVLLAEEIDYVLRSDRISIFPTKRSLEQ